MVPFNNLFFSSQQEQEEEDIPVQTLQFYDNKPTVDALMVKPTGLFYLLDEASRNTSSADFIAGDTLLIIYN